jgi:hypothetical protein
MTGSFVPDVMLWIDIATAAITVIGFLALPFLDND